VSMNRTVLGRTDLTAPTKLVWLFLQENYQSVGERPVTFSHKRIGECVGLSHRTVIRAVETLRRAGLLSTDRDSWSREPTTFTPKQPRRANTITVQSTATQGAFGD
jgi:hypothetical protein